LDYIFTISIELFWMQIYLNKFDLTTWSKQMSTLIFKISQKMSRTQVLITKKELFLNIFIIFRDIDQLVLALFKMKLEKF
jgi:hypothetical protein